MNPTLRFFAAVAPSMLAVAAVAAHAEWLLRQGTEVRLEVRPFDPMDALSGRYLAVPLAIRRLGAEVPRAQDRYAAGASVWVRLAPGEPWWRPVSVVDTPATAPDLALQARVQHQAGDELWLDYDLDRFFIPHDGADPTTTPEQHRLTAVVRITADGRGMFTDLLVDGEPYAAWNARQPR